MIRTLLLLLCSVTFTMAQFYPAIDPNTGWSIHGSKGNIYSIYMPIIQEDGITKDMKMMFSRVDLKEVYVCGLILQLKDLTHERDVIGGYGPVKGMYSYFSVNNCPDGIKREMYVEYLFNTSGDFSFRVGWTNDPGNTAVYVKFKVDYDIDGWADNIVDYVDYIPLVPLFKAAEKEHLVKYNDLDKIKENTIEYQTTARFTKAVSPERQLGFVFLQTAETPYELTIKKYPATSSYADPSVTVQSIGDPSGYPYAYSGSDQVAWLKLKENPARMGTFSIKGKAFVRPNARPIKLYVNMEIGLSSIDFTQEIGGGKTLADALNSLTHGKWEHVTTTGLSNPYSGGAMTTAQLHEFMLNSRANNGIYENRNEVTKYIAEANIINATWSAFPELHGVMFDDEHQGNQTYREGFAVLYKNITGKFSSASDVEEQTAQAIAHELGHVFNFSHYMSGCKGTTCSGGEIRTLMSYCTHKRSDGRLNNTCTGEYNPPVIDFYQNQPESRIKPGRFGINFQDYGSIPSYNSYQ